MEALHSCQLQNSVPPSTKREEKVDLFQFMLDMLITLVVRFKHNPMIWWPGKDLSKGGTTFCGLG